MRQPRKSGPKPAAAEIQQCNLLQQGSTVIVIITMLLCWGKLYRDKKPLCTTTQVHLTWAYIRVHDIQFLNTKRHSTAKAPCGHIFCKSCQFTHMVCLDLGCATTHWHQSVYTHGLPWFGCCTTHWHQSVYTYGTLSLGLCQNTLTPISSDT